MLIHHPMIAYPMTKKSKLARDIELEKRRKGKNKSVKNRGDPTIQDTKDKVYSRFQLQGPHKSGP